MIKIGHFPVSIARRSASPSCLGLVREPTAGLGSGDDRRAGRDRAADFDHDGSVGFTDLAMLLANWG
jgi:hypothetical protein